MNGLLIFNRYYTDAGQEYVKRRLTEAFAVRGVVLVAPKNRFAYGNGHPCEDAGFAIFWDKDIIYAKLLEQSCGLRVYNRSAAIEACDDKSKTYLTVGGILIGTTFAPLSYTRRNSVDEELLSAVERRYGYPIVVKENVGSRGEQVYLANNRRELEALYLRLSAVPHHYQPFTGKFGEDIRVYTVGGKAVAAIKRKNPNSFISNTANGGIAELFPLPEHLTACAEYYAKALGLDFGSIDFLESNEGTFSFLEANSNAYFTAIEKLGVNIADKIAEYVCKQQSKTI